MGTVRFRDDLHSRRQELPDGKTTLIGTPRQIRWVDSQTGRQIKAVAIKKGLMPAGFSADGRLALLTDLKELYLFDLTAEKIVRSGAMLMVRHEHGLDGSGRDGALLNACSWSTMSMAPWRRCLEKYLLTVISLGSILVSSP